MARTRIQIDVRFILDPDDPTVNTTFTYHEVVPSLGAFDSVLEMLDESGQFAGLTVDGTHAVFIKHDEAYDKVEELVDLAISIANRTHSSK